ncbi:GT-D fold domain-containing glycosyltransferase [Paenibacillus roseipurpureus]|uniref:GT-D fold domain-containing glycosyltransferase n=1 Tax=Paenibacillus roseopurpureus TaxID=2918901 RepID=A0AA96RHK3_9BACL|nr:GT-D fold domain-containing glycosyltransferase [Paenibacillus sp. MBLB1832]WNR43428.1 GT-D fold domain-containing glycosyltransferase [Paenibacillus sp. MBLB1832]
MGEFLTRRQTYTRIRYALNHKKPLSLVRIGDGENICLSQKSLWSIKRVMKEPWVKRKDKGVTLPNLRLRNQMVSEIRRASIVGLLSPNDTLIRAPRYQKRPLTNKVFAYFRISPRLTCNACINRYATGDKDFWKLLRGRRIFIISKHAKSMKKKLRKRGLNVVGTLSFTHYKQISHTVDKVGAKRHTFDLVLISTGVNAVILAPRIARRTRKVALDFGQWHKKHKGPA